MSDETKQIGNAHAINSDDKEALKGCVGCGCDEEAPATTGQDKSITVHASVSVGNLYFNLSVTALEGSVKPRPMDSQLLELVGRTLMNELHHNYTATLEEKSREFGRKIREAMEKRGKVFRPQDMPLENSDDAPVMPEETQAEVGRRIVNLFKKDGRE